MTAIDQNTTYTKGMQIYSLFHACNIYLFTYVVNYHIKSWTLNLFLFSYLFILLHKMRRRFLPTASQDYLTGSIYTFESN